MLCFGCVYFNVLNLKDYEKWAAANSRVRLESNYVDENFRLMTSQQNIYLQALDEPMWFGNSEHWKMWNHVQRIVSDIWRESNKFWILNNEVFQLNCH